MSNQTTGAFKEKSEQFGSKMSDAVIEGKDELESGISNTRDKVSDMTSHLGNKARNVAAKAKQSATDAYENVDQLLSEHPMQSFLVGMGVGCVLGIAVTTLLRRR
jgi:ElaB/YqjD/DUF883 family membrane-anchored ribosome-binding protein